MTDTPQAQGAAPLSVEEVEDFRRYVREPFGNRYPIWLLECTKDKEVARRILATIDKLQAQLGRLQAEDAASLAILKRWRKAARELLHGAHSETVHALIDDVEKARKAAAKAAALAAQREEEAR